MPYTTTPTELQRNYRKVFKRAKKIKDAIVILSNNNPEAVYIDYETYIKKMVTQKLVSDQNEKEKLLALAGTMSHQETSQLVKDVDEMFEQIDENDWK